MWANRLPREPVIVSVYGVQSLIGRAPKLSVNLVEGGGGHKKSATASAKGSFTVSFGALPMSDCTPYTLTITGSLGSRFAHTQEALPC